MKTAIGAPDPFDFEKNTPQGNFERQKKVVVTLIEQKQILLKLINHSLKSIKFQIGI